MYTRSRRVCATRTYIIIICTHRVVVHTLQHVYGRNDFGTKNRKTLQERGRRVVKFRPPMLHVLRFNLHTHVIIMYRLPRYFSCYSRGIYNLKGFHRWRPFLVLSPVSFGRRLFFPISVYFLKLLSSLSMYYTLCLSLQESVTWPSSLPIFIRHYWRYHRLIVFWYTQLFVRSTVQDCYPTRKLLSPDFKQILWHV
jgi:hypothetical protein